MKEIRTLIDRGEGGEEKEKEKWKCVHLDIHYF